MSIHVIRAKILDALREGPLAPAHLEHLLRSEGTKNVRIAIEELMDGGAIKLDKDMRLDVIQ